MKILLLAFSLQNDVFPLGLSYLKAYAQKFHPKTEIEIKEFAIGSKYTYETNKNTELQALSYIQLTQPDLLAFSSYIWSSQTIKDFARAVKLISPKTKILMGGVEVQPELLDNALDFLIKGEGEIAFKELLDYLQGQRELNQVHNIIYKDQNTNKIITNKITHLQNLDELPFPYIIGTKKDYAVIRMETTRGCLFNCKFCHYAQPELREFSLDYVKKSLDYLFENYSFKYLTFLDANFNIKKERMLEILDYIEILLQQHNTTFPRLSVHIELRPELIDEISTQKLSSYSFTISAELGLQSTNKEVLSAVNRPTNLNAVQKGLALLEKNNIQYKIDLMYGLPQDNFFAFCNSARFLLTNAPSQKKLVAHHWMQLNNTELQKDPSVTRFTPEHSSMVIKTSTQTVLELYQTKLFIDMLNEELKVYRLR